VQHSLQNLKAFDDSSPDFSDKVHIDLAKACGQYYICTTCGSEGVHLLATDSSSYLYYLCKDNGVDSRGIPTFGSVSPGSGENMMLIGSAMSCLKKILQVPCILAAAMLASVLRIIAQCYLLGKGCEVADGFALAEPWRCQLELPMWFAFNKEQRIRDSFLRKRSRILSQRVEYYLSAHFSGKYH